MKLCISIFSKITIFVFVIFSFSCSYRPSNPKGLHDKIYIRVVNESFAPRFGIILKRKLKEELILTSNFELVESSSQSNLDLFLTVKDFSKKQGIAFDDDPLIAKSLSNQILIDVKVSDKKPHFYSYSKSMTASSPSIKLGENVKASNDKAFLEIAENFSRQIRFFLINDISISQNE